MIVVEDQERPDTHDPITNIAIEVIYRRLVPKRSAAQPVAGITAARARV